MKKNGTLLFITLMLTSWLALPVYSQVHKADDILGVWLNEEATGKIQLYKENGKYHGKIIWLKETTDKVTGQPRTDKENPDEKLKTRPLMGLVNMTGFSFVSEDDEWSGGSIYDPKNGKTYKCYIKFDSPNKLKVRGYIGVSMIGRNTYWTRSVAPKN